jgi:hypothetical protein
MPIPDTNGIPPFADFDMLKSKINEIVQKYNNLLVNLDTLNVVTLNAKVIEAGTITADKMNVTELSAITANLGTIIAGIIRGISIYGSYIATAEGTYPRSEMDVAGNLFAAYQSATNSLKILPNVVGAPRMTITDGSISASIALLSALGGAVGILANGCNLHLLPDPGFNVVVPDWSQFYSTADAQTLQTALDNLSNSISALASSMSSKADYSYVTSSLASNMAFDSGTRNLKLFAPNGSTIATVNIP